MSTITECSELENLPSLSTDASHLSAFLRRFREEREMSCRKETAMTLLLLLLLFYCLREFVKDLITFVRNKNRKIFS